MPEKKSFSLPIKTIAARRWLDVSNNRLYHLDPYILELRVPYLAFLGNRDLSIQFTQGFLELFNEPRTCCRRLMLARTRCHVTIKDAFNECKKIETIRCEAGASLDRVESVVGVCDLFIRLF